MAISPHVVFPPLMRTLRSSTDLVAAMLSYAPLAPEDVVPRLAPPLVFLPDTLPHAVVPQPALPAVVRTGDPRIDVRTTFLPRGDNMTGEGVGGKIGGRES